MFERDATLISSDVIDDGGLSGAGADEAAAGEDADESEYAKPADEGQ